MAYIKTEWENEPSENTPLNASNLNKIENGIYNNSINIGELEDLDTTDKTNIVAAINEANQNGTIVDSLDGSSTTEAPSVRAVNEGLQDIYSTNETKTNKIWIDGKNIYKKTYVFNNLGSNGLNPIDISSLNIDTFLPCEAFGAWKNGGSINWPYYVSSTDYGRIYKDNSVIHILYKFPNYDNHVLTCTIYYTKTTD